MSKNKNIKHQMTRALEEKIQLNSSRKSDERKHGGTAEHIHSERTVETYMKVAKDYGDWLRDHGQNHCSWEYARDHARLFIEEQKSAYTQHAYRSALAKVFGVHGEDLCRLEQRHAREIERGRDRENERNLAIERNHAESVAILRSCGLRHSEEAQLTPENITIKPNGEVHVHITGKGGKDRDVLCIGRGAELIRERIADLHERKETPSHVRVEHAIETVKEHAERPDTHTEATRKPVESHHATESNMPEERTDQPQRASAGFLVGSTGNQAEWGVSLVNDLPTSHNAHALRADFAARCYEYAMEHGYGTGEVYHSDTWNKDFDKGALDFASHQLGHGDGRFETVINNYLSYGRSNTKAVN